jgi:hypothetical protein
MNGHAWNGDFHPSCLRPLYRHRGGGNEPAPVDCHQCATLANKIAQPGLQAIVYPKIIRQDHERVTLPHCFRLENVKL